MSEAPTVAVVGLCGKETTIARGRGRAAAKASATAPTGSPVSRRASATWAPAMSGA